VDVVGRRGGTVHWASGGDGQRTGWCWSRGGGNVLGPGWARRYTAVVGIVGWRCGESSHQGCGLSSGDSRGRVSKVAAVRGSVLGSHRRGLGRLNGGAVGEGVLRRAH
jgi:hypothetical protein